MHSRAAARSTRMTPWASGSVLRTASSRAVRARRASPLAIRAKWARASATTSTAHGPQALVLIRQGPAQEGEEVRLGEGFEDEDPGPGQQRPDDLEIGVFGGGPDEGEEPFLHVGQQGVLLGLVEAVDFVDQQDGAAALRPASRRASSTTLRTSATPDMTALRLANWASMTRAITRASVVLPLPGGPQKIMEER